MISGGKYSLTPTESYVDTWLGGSSPDVIFEVIMTDVDNRGSDALGRMYIQEGYGDYLPSADVVDLIDTLDVRSQLFKEDASD